MILSQDDLSPSGPNKGVAAAHVMPVQGIDADVVARAEAALKSLSAQFSRWLQDETEARWYSKNLRPILDENWTWIAERDGDVGQRQLPRCLGRQRPRRR